MYRCPLAEGNPMTARSRVLRPACLRTSGMMLAAVAIHASLAVVVAAAEKPEALLAASKATTW